MDLIFYEHKSVVIKSVIKKVLCYKHQMILFH